GAGLGRVRERPAGGSLVGLEQQRDDAAPCAGCVGLGGADHAGVGHDEEHQVLGGEVRAEAAGGLGPVDQLDRAAVGLTAALFLPAGGGEAHRQQVGEPV